MELCLGRMNIRALMNEFRRNADGQTMRQGQRSQIEIRRRPVARCLPNQNRQGVLGHA
jgi:hypothetical protein